MIWVSYFNNKMSISTFFRIILIAISADVAHKVTRLLVYNQNYIWNWCLMDKSIFDFSDSIISDAIFLVVVGPFVEELIFRYFGFKLVRHFYPKISTLYLILVTSFVFTLSHNQYWSVDINWSVLTGIFLISVWFAVRMDFRHTRKIARFLCIAFSLKLNSNAIY